MQTFLVYPNFIQSAKCLDNKRLGKQRLEAWQILQTLTGQSQGWKNHPAVRMWAGHESALAWYGECICEEWISRGFKDTMKERFFTSCSVVKCPEWLGREDFHASHRSNLLRKAPEHYRQFGWSESDNLPYVWPS